MAKTSKPKQSSGQTTTGEEASLLSRGLIVEVDLDVEGIPAAVNKLKISFSWKHQQVYLQRQRQVLQHQ